MVDKNYCMSSFLTLRYVEDKNAQFKKGLRHTLDIPYPENKKILVHNANDIAEAYKHFFKKRQKTVKLGILLSGGMDSACLAAFLKPGTDAYTFRFLNGKFCREELQRAKLYAKKCKLKLHYVDIDWKIIKKHVLPLMKTKGAPIHSIEPQIMEAALQAKKDGVEQLVSADGCDSTFGGLDKLLSKDWDFDDFVNFFTYVDPKKVLKNPVSMNYLFERYRLPGNKIDYLRFINEIFAHESSGSYYNAVVAAKMKYRTFFNPCEYIKMAEPLDLKRIRKGDSKYLIRELFKVCYPDIPVPEKMPMPRPVDEYFKNWNGPTRPEFLPNLDLSKFNGNQKWLIWCLEYFLNHLDLLNSK